MNLTKKQRKQLYDRNWRKNHKQWCDNYRRKYHLLHPEIRRNCRKRWKKLHPDKVPSYKGISKEAFEKIKIQQGFRCALCGKPEPFLDQWWHFLTQDHIVPRSKGGKKRSKSNIQAMCWDCNVKIKRDIYSPLTGKR